MLITYDTEFLDDGKTIELISIGMVAENGDEYYAVVEDAAWSRILTNDWLVNNVVVPHLPHIYDQDLDGPIMRLSSRQMKRKSVIAAEVESFLFDHANGLDGSINKVPDLWADHPATDHVALYQLFGPMIECTKHGMPMRTSCLAQEEESLLRRYRRSLHVEQLSDRLQRDWSETRPEQDWSTKHHALHDARYDMALARWLGLTS